MERIAEFLRSPIEILDAAKEVGISASECNRLLKRAGNMAQEGLASSKMDQADFLKGILDRAIIHSDSAQVRLNAVSLFRSILGEREAKPEFAEAHLINLSCSLQSKFRGGAIQIVVGNVQPAASETNLAILKAVARARSWYDQIVSGEVSSIPELARQHGVTPRYVKKILPCALLRPGIVEAIVNRECPSQLTLSALTEEVSLDWTSQKETIA
jgi:site-specific DNA recombinase